MSFTNSKATNCLKFNTPMISVPYNMVRDSWCIHVSHLSLMSLHWGKGLRKQTNFCHRQNVNLGERKSWRGIVSYVTRMTREELGINKNNLLKTSAIFSVTSCVIVSMVLTQFPSLQMVEGGSTCEVTNKAGGCRELPTISTWGLVNQILKAWLFLRLVVVINAQVIDFRRQRTAQEAGGLPLEWIFSQTSNRTWPHHLYYTIPFSTP